MANIENLDGKHTHKILLLSLILVYYKFIWTDIFKDLWFFSITQIMIYRWNLQQVGSSTIYWVRLYCIVFLKQVSGWVSR